jgi:hypothetical protein
MSLRLFLALPASFLLWLNIAVGADLTKIERTLVKEPAYRTTPRYCLLVFGSEVKTKIWLVQDGDMLYVDRNGNGDLTEAGNKVAAEKPEAGDDSGFTFKVGEVHDGPRLHKELTVTVADVTHIADVEPAIKALLARNPKARGYLVSVEMELPEWKGTGIGGRVRQHAFVVDSRGVFQFSETPRDAPIVHFGGPWSVALFGEHRLTIGRESDVVLGVGTPGIGPGTTAWVDYDRVIPADVYPTLDIVYPPKHPGEPPVKEHHVLKRRC